MGETVTQVYKVYQSDNLIQSQVCTEAEKLETTQSFRSQNQIQINEICQVVSETVLCNIDNHSPIH